MGLELSGYFCCASVGQAKEHMRRLLLHGELASLPVIPFLYDGGDWSDLTPVQKKHESERLKASCLPGDGFLACVGYDHVEVGTVCVRRGVELCLESRPFVEEYFRTFLVPLDVERPVAILFDPIRKVVLHAGSASVLSSMARDYVARSCTNSDACYMVATGDLSVLDLYCWGITTQRKTSKQAQHGCLVVPMYKFFYYLVVPD